MASIQLSRLLGLVSGRPAPSQCFAVSKAPSWVAKQLAVRIMRTGNTRRGTRRRADLLIELKEEFWLPALKFLTGLRQQT